MDTDIDIASSEYEKNGDQEKMNAGLEELSSDDIPEFTRIKGYFKSLEDEFNLSKIDLSISASFVVNEIDSDDDFVDMDASYFPDMSEIFESETESENDEKQKPNDVQQLNTPNRVRFINTTHESNYCTPNITPIKLNKTFSLAEMVRQETPNSKVDAFFEILKNSGYSYDINTHSTTKSNTLRRTNSDKHSDYTNNKANNSQLSAMCNDYFFTSAHSPTKNNQNRNDNLTFEFDPNNELTNNNPIVSLPSTATQQTSISLFDTPVSAKHSGSFSNDNNNNNSGNNNNSHNNSSMVSETSTSTRMNDLSCGIHIEFTPESLKLNWDMEEDNDPLNNSMLSTTSSEAAAEQHLANLSPNRNGNNSVTKNKNKIFTPDTSVLEAFALQEKERIAKEKGDLFSVSQEDTGLDMEINEINGDENSNNNSGNIHGNSGNNNRTYNSINSNNKNSNNINVSSGVDLRLQGDFTVWSSGAKCSLFGIKEAYIGLYATLLTHNVENGQLVHASNSNNSNNINSGGGNNSSGYNGGLNSTSGELHNKYSSPLRSSLVPLSTPVHGSGSNTTGYYSVRVLECVIRPDILLSTIMTVIVSVARTHNFQINTTQRSQLLLTTQKPLRRSSFETLTNVLHVTSTDKNNSSAGGSINHREFDCIDIQVCISKELRQRVLLVQFFKKVPALGGMFSGAGNIVTYKTLKESPVTRKFITQLKKEFTATNMSLSALYTSSLRTVCSLPTGLDTHFKAQLHTLVRDNMWIKLENDYRHMDEHVAVQENECVLFRNSLDFMYKQYNLPLPAPWSRKRLQNNSSHNSSNNNSKQHNNSNSRGSIAYGSGDHSPVFISESDFPCSPIRIRSNSDLSIDSTDQAVLEAVAVTQGKKVGHLTDIDDFDHNCPISSAATANTNKTITKDIISNNSNNDNNSSNNDSSRNDDSFDTVQLHTANNTPVRTQNTTTQNTPQKNSHTKVKKSTPNSTNHHNNHNHNNRSNSNSNSTVKAGKDLSFSNSDSGNNSSYIEELLLMKKVDGMTFCLVMLDKCYQELQKECDAEYSARMTHRNSVTVSLIDDILDYKQSLLVFMANLHDVENTALMKTFAATFANISITTSIAMHAELCKGATGSINPVHSLQAKTLNATKSWLMSGINLISNSNNNNNSGDSSNNNSNSSNSVVISNNNSGSSNKTSIESTATSPIQSGWSVLWGGNKATASTPAIPPTQSKTTASTSTNGFSTKFKATHKSTTFAPTVHHHPSFPETNNISHNTNQKDESTQQKVNDIVHNSLPSWAEDITSDFDTELNEGFSEDAPNNPHTKLPTDMHSVMNTLNNNSDMSVSNSGSSGGSNTNSKINSHISTLHTTGGANGVLLYYCACLVSNVPATLYVTTTVIAVAYNNMIGSIIQYASGSTSTISIPKSGKELWPLGTLAEIELPVPGQNNRLTSNTMKFVFSFAKAEDGAVVSGDSHNNGIVGGGNSNKTSNSSTKSHSDRNDSLEMYISPVVVDCARLHAIVMEIKRKFV